MNVNQAMQKLRESDGILQMELHDLYSLFVQYRTDADQPIQNGNFLEEFKIVIKELLTDAQFQHHSPSS